MTMAATGSYGATEFLSPLAISSRLFDISTSSIQRLPERTMSHQNPEQPLQIIMFVLCLPRRESTLQAGANWNVKEEEEDDDVRCQSFHVFHILDPSNQQQQRRRRRHPPHLKPLTCTVYFVTLFRTILQSPNYNNTTILNLSARTSEMISENREALIPSCRLWCWHKSHYYSPGV